MAALRARASALRATASELRRRSAGVASRAGAMAWASRAGDVLREQLTSVASDLGRQARLLDDAADALERHAGAVASVKEEIARVQRTTEALWQRARSLVSAAVGVVAGAADPASAADLDRARSLVSAVRRLPNAGSQEWLTIGRTARQLGFA